ncbi:MAG: hypothetical protein HYZ11_12670 [Candidatus Tectomicrobia bacterium]|uniref:Uncharacterized protein n=1 Tax=Tectimicrobiota bacterium TaxID=2528274 RepID=A0A932I339_UNCTE|nr:hypothetical protein [Candidatus Tectomicrobia bacterium]
MSPGGSKRASEREDFLSLSPRIRVIPVVHASGDFAQEARDRLLRLEPDCLAVPLPPSFEESVEAGVEALPRVSLAAAREEEGAWSREWEREDEEEESGEGEGEEDAPDLPAFNYVPVDPCQAVVAALRTAMGERIPRAWVDLEVAAYDPESHLLPDPYALKKVPLDAFAAALLPASPPPAPGSQREARVRWMASRLRALERDHKKIAFLCHALDWPWVRQAYLTNLPAPEEEASPPRVRLYEVEAGTLAFLLGELPFVTSLYERRREELRGDRHLSLDGVKELLLEARAAWLAEHNPVHNWVTPQRLQVFLQYVRNLTLQTRRLTPDLFTLVVAAKQCAGDAFALCLAETARKYPYQDPPPQSPPYEGGEGKGPARRSGRQDFDSPPDQGGGRGGEEEGAWNAVRMGIGKAEFPEGDVGGMKNRLGGSPVSWRNISLKPKPRPFEKRKWAQRWDPYGMCSWPPEDTKIESFHTHVREQAKALLGEDLARTEKFTVSIKDGLDMRETLRNWHTGDLYVKEIPPARGSVEVVVFLFESPADPDKYSWRTMWYAEHEEESTLCMYATPFEGNMVGPGIAESQYGGAFFLFPPRHLPDVWRDPRLAFTETLEERLIAGACLHSREKSVALVSPRPPLARWRQIARVLKRHLIYLPLGRFSGETIARVRRFHVLNGRHVRSYAARFIREM